MKLFATLFLLIGPFFPVLYEPDSSIPPLEVSMPFYYEVRGQSRIVPDNNPFPGSTVKIYDGQENLIYLLQTDDNGAFIFPALAGETYVLRGAQDTYAYAPSEIKLENISAHVSGLLFYAGPETWFPPACQLPADIACATKSQKDSIYSCTTTPMNVLNAPCYMDVTAVATDDQGNKVNSEPVRIYFHPLLTPSPTPTPTPSTRFVNGYVKVDGLYFGGNAVVSANGQTFTTQPGGYFELHAVPIGSALTASAPGYVFPSLTIDLSEYFIIDGTPIVDPTPTPTPAPSPTSTPVPSPTPGPCTTTLPNGKCKKGCICTR